MTVVDQASILIAPAAPVAAAALDTAAWLSVVEVDCVDPTAWLSVVEGDCVEPAAWWRRRWWATG